MVNDRASTRLTNVRIATSPLHQLEKKWTYCAEEGSFPLLQLRVLGLGFPACSPFRPPLRGAGVGAGAPLSPPVYSLFRVN